MKNEALYRTLGALETEELPQDAAQAGRIAARALQLAGLRRRAHPARHRAPGESTAGSWRWPRRRCWPSPPARWRPSPRTGFRSYTPPGDPRQASALLAEIGTAVGESRTAGDYTVTLLGTISDGYDAVIAFSVEPQREGAAALDSRCVFAENLLMQEELLLGLEEAGENGFPAGAARRPEPAP